MDETSGVGTRRFLGTGAVGCPGRLAGPALIPVLKSGLDSTIGKEPASAVACQFWLAKFGSSGPAAVESSLIGRRRKRSGFADLDYLGVDYSALFSEVPE